MFRRRSPEKIEENIEELRLRNEELELKRQIAEKEAIIAELRRRYGPRWRQILGLNDLSLASLRAVLGRIRQGAERQGSLETLRKGVDISHLRRLL
jgi:hypothetical protein